MNWGKFKELSADKQIGIVFTIIGGLWLAYTYFDKKPSSSAPQNPPSSISINGSVSADNGAIQAIGGDITVNVRDPQDAKIIERLLANLDEKERQAGDQSQQIAELEKTIEALRAKKDQPGVQDALTLLEKGETSKAEDLFQKTLERKKKEGRKALQEAAEAARHIGSLAYFHDTEKALKAYREAVKLDPDNASGWNGLGLLQDRIGDLDDAEKSYLTVSEIAKKTNDRKAFAAAYGNLGNVYQTRGDLDKAVEMYNKALEIEKALGSKQGMAIDYGNLGNVYYTRGDLDKAVEMLNKALEINEALGRKQGMAANYGNLGNVYYTRGNLDKAVEMYSKSLEIEKALGRKEGMASDYGNLGVVYQTRGDLDKAVEMYNKALEIHEALGRKEGLAANYGNLGLVYKTRGDLDKAVEMFNKALEIHEALGSKQGMAIDYGNLGVVYETRGDLDRAVEMYNKALSLFQEIGAEHMVETVQGWVNDLLAAQKEAVK